MLLPRLSPLGFRPIYTPWQQIDSPLIQLSQGYLSRSQAAGDFEAYWRWHMRFENPRFPFHWVISKSALTGVRRCTFLVLQHVGDMCIHIVGLVCNQSYSKNVLCESCSRCSQTDFKLHRFRLWNKQPRYITSGLLTS